MSKLRFTALTIGVFFAIYTAHSAPALADAVEDAERCRNGANSSRQLALELALDHCRAALESASLSDGQRVAVLTERARALLALGHYTAAAEDLAAARMLEPGYLPSFVLQAEIFLKLAENELAADQLSKALAIEPKNYQLLIRRADLYLRLNRGEEAIADFSTVAKALPDNPSAQANLGASYLRFAYFEDAIAALSRTIELKPDHPNALLSRARSYTALGRFSEARSDIDRHIELVGATANSLFWRAMTNFRADLFEDSLRDLDGALELNPRFSSAHALKGHALLRAGRGEEGLQTVLEALNLNPNDSVALDISGLILLARERHEDALRNFSSALNTSPSFAEVYLHRAVTRLELHTRRPQLQLYKRVIEDLDQAIKHRPYFPDAFATRAMVHAMIGENEKAALDLAAALEQKPRSAGAWVMKGTIAYLGDNYDEASRSLSEALAIEPDNSGAHMIAAWVELERNNIDAVVANLRASSEDHPNPSGTAWLNRALVHFSLHEFEETLGALDNTSRAGRDDPMVPVWRHISSLRAGQASKLEMPLDVDPVGWPGLVYGLFNGIVSAEELLRLIPSYGEREDLEITTSALFFLGQKALLEGRIEDAQSFFRQAVAMGQNHLHVVAVARHELRHIDE